jgi:hypothetical protein
MPRLRSAVAAAVPLLALLCPLPARAYRPFDQTDASVAEAGEVELELGPLGFVKDGTDRSLVVPTLTINWGFAEGFELVLEARHVLQLGEVGGASRWRVDGTALSVKGVLHEGSLQDRTGVSVASEVAALLPDPRGGTSGAGAQLALIASRRWTDATVHVNGAVAWARTHRPAVAGGVIVEVHDAWPVRPVAELVVEGERDAPTLVAGLAGAIWRVQEDLSFDAGLRRARAGGVSATEVRAGLTWAFGVGFPRVRRKS